MLNLNKIDRKSRVFSLVLCILFFLFPTVSFADIASTITGVNTNGFMIPNVDPGATLNTYSGLFLQGASEAAEILIGPAKSILFWLFAIDLTWTGINWVLETPDLQAISGTLAKKVLYIAFMVSMIDYVGGAAKSGNLMDNQNWIATIPNSFVAIGNDIGESADIFAGFPDVFTGTGGGGANTSIGVLSSFSINPGKMLNDGILIGLEFIAAVLFSFMNISIILPWNIFADLIIFIIAIFAMVLIIMMFAMLAADMLVNFIEAYITMAVGVFLIGFSGSRWTMVNVNVFFQYMIGLGVRMLLGMSVYAICSAMLQQEIQSHLWTNFTNIDPSKGWNLVIDTLGECFIMFMVTKSVPDIAAGLSSNSPMLTAAAGLKAGVSGFEGGLKGAALGAQALGASMKAGGNALDGKHEKNAAISKMLTPKSKDGGGGDKPSVQPKPPGGSEGGGKEKEKNPFGGLGKDVKTLANNLTGRKGSAVGNMKDAKSVGGSVSHAMRSSIANGKHRDGTGFDPNKKRDVARGIAGKNLRLMGKMATAAGKSMDTSKDKNGNAKGNFLAKGIGGLAKHGPNLAPDDKPAINYISTLNIDLPE